MTDEIGAIMVVIALLGIGVMMVVTSLLAWRNDRRRSDQNADQEGPWHL